MNNVEALAQLEKVAIDATYYGGRMFKPSQVVPQMFVNNAKLREALEVIAKQLADVETLEIGNQIVTLKKSNRDGNIFIHWTDKVQNEITDESRSILASLGVKFKDENGEEVF